MNVLQLIRHRLVAFFILIHVISHVSTGCSDSVEATSFTTRVTDSLLLPYTAHVYNSALSKGYYFLFTYRMKKNAPATVGFQQVLDGNGHTVYFRKAAKATDFKLHPCGLMSFFGDGKCFIMDSTFRIIDSVGCLNGGMTDVHDFLILPNGNYLLIGTEVYVEDLSRLAIFMNKNLPGSKRAFVSYGIVQEINRKKQIVSDWHAKPYFRIEDVEKNYLTDTLYIDVTHFNSIDVDRAGNYIISARYSNEIIKVKKSDGTLLWRLGGNKNQFRFIGDTVPFLGQHDARLLNNGHLLLFDNGYGNDAVQHNVRVLEYELNETKKTATLVWSYTPAQKTVSLANGNARRSDDGKTLVNFGKVKNGTPNITFVMLDTNKEKLFELSYDDTIGSYRTYYYPELPFQLKRPTIRIIEDNGSWLLEAEKGHMSYNWSTGETIPIIRVMHPGTYSVFVPYGDGGFVSSEVVRISR